MIADSPLFGWGINSYQTLAPYYNDASLLNHNYEAIPSSIINFFVNLVSSARLLFVFYRSFYTVVIKKETKQFFF